jgi:hypothetical protein
MKNSALGTSTHPSSLWFSRRAPVETLPNHRRRRPLRALPAALSIEMNLPGVPADNYQQLRAAQ